MLPSTTGAARAGVVHTKSRARAKSPAPHVAAVPLAVPARWEPRMRSRIAITLMSEHSFDRERDAEAFGLQAFLGRIRPFAAMRSRDGRLAHGMRSIARGETILNEKDARS